MASISLPPQSQPGFSQHLDSLPSDSNANHRLSMPTPLPNPPFVFPARDSGAFYSHSEISQRRSPPPALPAFSFNPGSQQAQPAQAPSRPNGHRRRPSEFVGGDQSVTPRSGENIEKREECTAPTQPSALSGPPGGRTPGRRNHAHRRSAAVSGVDLNAISKALATNPTAANASSFSIKPMLDTGHESVSRPLSRSTPSLGRPTPPASPQLQSIPPVPTAVHIQPISGNDDTDIGRSVSGVSYEAQAASASNPVMVTFQQTDRGSPTSHQRTTRQGKSTARPKTADASLVLDLTPNQDAPEVPSMKRSKSTGHSRSRKSMSTGHLTSTLATPPPTDDAHSTDTSRPSYSDDGSEMSSDVDHDEVESPSAKKARSKSKRKQKRVRSWAGSILTRSKGKRRHAKTNNESMPVKQISTRPTLKRTNSEVGSVMEVDFDNDDVVVLRTPSNPAAPSAPVDSSEEQPSMSVSTLENSWKPRSFYEQAVQTQADSLCSPIIDLDAALGPFNTPDMRPIAMGAPSKFSVATQRMYSGGRRGEFVGPEMRYHRRAESAPVMPPFDRSSLSLNRLGGTSAGAPDVFYEEEEDAFLAANQTSKKEELMHDVAIVSSSDDESISTKSDDTAITLVKLPEPSSPQQTGLGIQPAKESNSPPEASSPVEKDASDVGQCSTESAPEQSRSPLKIVKSEELVPKVLAPPSPDTSSRFLTVDKRPATSPYELTPNIPLFSISTGVSPSGSPFPTPEAPRFMDRNFSSHSYHHLPSDYQYASVEDVPSLTSSASTMTNRHRFSASFIPRGRLSTDRAVSFSAAIHRRGSQTHSSKKSSLAGLSRLVGGQSSERSKLDQEEKPPSDPPEKTKKKNRRLSRLMHFWKPRDKDSSTTESVTSLEMPL